MAQLPKIIKDFTGWIDGVGLAGRLEEGTLPKVALVTEEIVLAGMGGTVDGSMGLLEKMESALTMVGLSSDFTKMLGSEDGALTLRGAISDGSETQSAIFQMRGLFKEVEFGSMKRKDKGSTKIMATLSYFRATVENVEVLECDVMNKVFRVHGVDRFAELRAALGA